jgi:hypothetical protein
VIKQVTHPDLEKYHQLQRNYDELLEEVKKIWFKAKTQNLKTLITL